MRDETITMTAAARTDVGRARTNNEDAYALVDLGSGAVLGPDATEIGQQPVLLALSDGLGGAQAGEVASALVVDVLARSLRKRAGILLEHALDRSVRVANNAVHLEAKAQGRRGMGATLTAVVARGTRAYIAEVGDSRAYLLRAGELHQLTRDQSLVQVLVDRGELTPEEASRSDRKNVILQAMGTSAEIRPALGRLSLRRGDRILVCCDGLSNAVGGDELAAILGGLEPDAACERMIDLANIRGGLDNLTAIVAVFDGPGLDPPRESESLSDTYVVLREFVG